MARTVTSGFSELKSNLEITGLQSSTVSTRQQEIRSAVERRMTVQDSFLTGSYARSTMIAPLHECDIDVFVVLNDQYFDRFRPEAVLDRLRSALRETYPKTPSISPNGQAVTISFNDFKADVVPAFELRGGGFLIPNTHTGKWISTDPRAHNRMVASSNQRHAGSVVPLIKMIKGWNKFSGEKFVGLYLDLMTVKLLDNVGVVTDFSSTVRLVLDRARDAVRYTIPDPAGFGDVIYPYRDGLMSRDKAAQHVDTYYRIARQAEVYAAFGDHQAAIGEWRKVFGDYFPAYG